MASDSTKTIDMAWVMATYYRPASSKQTTNMAGSDLRCASETLESPIQHPKYLHHHDKHSVATGVSNYGAGQLRTVEPHS